MKLTKEQNDWIQEKLQGKDIIYLGVHGSHLYGLDREESDIDLKAVYAPSKTQLVRGEAIKTYNYKNDELNIEIEVKSLPSFIRSASSCDTNCVDLLHAPDNMCLSKTDLWNELKEQRSSMYAKNMRGIVGYIKTHSKKYTNKIERLNEMKKLQELCTTIESQVQDAKVKDVAINSYSEQSNFKYVKFVSFVKEGEQQYLEVCGKKYIYTWSIEQLQEALKTDISKYGERSNKGADKGIDGKSLSHALRVLYELKEIILTKDLKFPLQNADYIKKVKTGEITNVIEVLNVIDELYEECMELLDKSDFPDEVDITEMYKILEKYYF